MTAATVIQLIITGGLAAAITSLVGWLKDRRRNAADTNQIMQGIYEKSVEFADKRLDEVRDDLALCNKKCDAFSDLVMQVINQEVDPETARSRHKEIRSWAA
jgi:hypothetical protein